MQLKNFRAMLISAITTFCVAVGGGAAWAYWTDPGGTVTASTSASIGTLGPVQNFTTNCSSVSYGTPFRVSWTAPANPAAGYSYKVAVNYSTGPNNPTWNTGTDSTNNNAPFYAGPATAPTYGTPVATTTTSASWGISSANTYYGNTTISVTGPGGWESSAQVVYWKIVGHTACIPIVSPCSAQCSMTPIS